MTKRNLDSSSCPKKLQKPTLFYPTALFLLILTCNGASIFNICTPTNSPPKWVLSASSTPTLSLNEEEDPPAISKTLVPILPLNLSSSLIRENKLLRKIFHPSATSQRFPSRIKRFLNENSSCRIRFFMTWISSHKNFGERETLAVESVFKSHPNACLIIVSESMDSISGTKSLGRFLHSGFKLIALSPNYNYLFRNTHAATWLWRLKRGKINPGEVPLGQNLSNILRLTLLYKYGGIYIDADVFVLKPLYGLRNSIGAQTRDIRTGKWSRLNTAVMAFEKTHPLVFEFIKEFSLTFDGNRWGHNGPYLVSRVAGRVAGRAGFQFAVLAPEAFYPVDWSRVGTLFEGVTGRNDDRFDWVSDKIREMKEQSLAIHLWNRESRKMKVQEGSVMFHIMSHCCIFCNSSSFRWDDSFRGHKI